MAKMHIPTYLGLSSMTFFLLNNIAQEYGPYGVALSKKIYRVTKRYFILTFQIADYFEFFASYLCFPPLLQT